MNSRIASSKGIDLSHNHWPLPQLAYCLCICSLATIASGQELTSGQSVNQSLTTSLATELKIPSSTFRPPQTTERPGSVTKLVTWKSSNFAFKNLVFEEPDFERQPWSSTGLNQDSISGIRFFYRSVTLPSKIARGKLRKWQFSEAVGRPR